MYKVPGYEEVQIFSLSLRDFLKILNCLGIAEAQN